MAEWKDPPRIKIYEALGAIADARVHVDGNAAKVYSSSGNKYYNVFYEPGSGAITANDNGSYWRGYLGYPSIAFLLDRRVIAYRPDLALVLAGIPWKDINTEFSNDYTRVETVVKESLIYPKGASEADLDREITSIMNRIAAMKISKLPRRARPPAGY